MTKKQKEKLEQEYIDKKTPYDSAIKSTIKTIQEIKQVAKGDVRDKDSHEKSIFSLQIILDFYKDRADDYKRINK